MGAFTVAGADDGRPPRATSSAASAIETLFALLGGEPVGEIERVLPTRLVVRESSGA